MGGQRGLWKVELLQHLVRRINRDLPQCPTTYQASGESD
jgi:hypothetical protein